MSNISPLLPRLTVNSRFIDEFLAAEAPCCALGLVEERKQTYYSVIFIMSDKVFSVLSVHPPW
jgi:hypothetical protein